MRGNTAFDYKLQIFTAANGKKLCVDFQRYYGPKGLYFDEKVRVVYGGLEIRDDCEWQLLMNTKSIDTLQSIHETFSSTNTKASRERRINK
jgi:hypothetical protein